jgi:predicted PurR-regulated permease PerM
MTDFASATLTRRIILFLLLGGVVLLSYAVLRLFLVPVAWALILAYTTWPIYVRLRRCLVGRESASALIMTLLLTGAIVVPLLLVMIFLRGEVTKAYAAVLAYLAQGQYPLPGFIVGIPWLGEWLQRFLDQIAGDPVATKSMAAEWIKQWNGELLAILGSIGRDAAKFGFALVAVFFFYRDGETVLDQVRSVLRQFTGARIDGYLQAIGSMTKAVVYGLVLTALAQGVLAGLGYWAAGVTAPLLLGALTVLIALIPFGTPFVWGSVGVWLLLNEQVAAGVGLLLWGILVVSWVDNLIRPLVISTATRIPFLLVMFGVLGGLAAFGLVGLFLGPVILAVLMAVWREWLEESRLPLPAPDPERVAG